MTHFDPFARTLIKGEELLYRRFDPSTDARLINCGGVYNLVRSKAALFLIALEDDYRTAWT